MVRRLFQRGTVSVRAHGFRVPTFERRQGITVSLNRIGFLNRLCLLRSLALTAIFGLTLPLVTITAHAQGGAQNAPAPKAPAALGTIKTISGGMLTLATDSGAEVKVQLPTDVKVLRVPPGSRDLREATPIQLSDLQPGDRILVRGKPGDEAGSMIATTVVAMKRADIAEKQSKERDEWQRRGIGGLVTGVDVASNVVTIKSLTMAGTKEVAIRVGGSTILRRYAPGSVNFDDAKVAPLSEIRVGDQLRARGTKSADGNEFSADEIVSGSFHNIAGMITAVNSGSGTLTVSDLATKKSVELKVTPDSQMRKLPQPMAQRIAMRLKGNSADANDANGTGQPTGQPAGPPAVAAAPGNAGPGGPPRNGSGDLQQMLSRLPVSPLSDFLKGDAVMIVATAGPTDGRSMVITLLGGVEPILQSSTQGQAASILTPWSLNSGGGDAGTP
jgi:hypothetical protein